LTVPELSAVLLAAGAGLDSGDPWRALRAARTHLLVALAAYTGLRVSELCGLCRGVVGRAGERHVLKDVAGKGGTRSRVVIPPALHAEIEAFGRRLEAMVGPLGPDEPLLPALGRRPQPGRAVLAPLSPRRARDLVDGALAAAGRDERRTGPHLLRATAITMVYMGSHDAFLAQRFARHARADTTARYIRAADELSETGSDYLAVDDPVADALT
jgi:integrase